jgi:hypothetical protein
MYTILLISSKIATQKRKTTEISKEKADQISPRGLVKLSHWLKPDK